MTFTLGNIDPPWEYDDWRENMTDSERYQAAAHAMQSGVAMEMNHNPKPTEPKHLRVGVNAAMVDHSGLVELLIKKGLITREEYISAIADAMEREKSRYEEALTRRLGTKVSLA